jgi:enoyl-CoA hydratase
MTEPHVHVEIRRPHVVVVTLDRPPVNALSRGTRESLLRVFDRLEADDTVRAVVLTARGRIFCAGADIKEKATEAEAVVAGDYLRANRLTRDVFFAVLESSKPVIAAVQGAALGAGLVLAACCDMIFADESAVFAMPEIDVGQGGGASFLQRILPPPKIRRMVLTGERVPAAEMYRLGAVEACLSEDELLPAALAVAETIATKSTEAVSRIRSSFAAVETLSLRDGFRLEQVYTTELSRSPAAAAARQAFFDRRLERKA